MERNKNLPSDKKRAEGSIDRVWKALHGWHIQSFNDESIVWELIQLGLETAYKEKKD